MKPILHVDIFKDKWHIIKLAGIVLHKLNYHTYILNNLEIQNIYYADR